VSNEVIEVGYLNSKSKFAMDMLKQMPSDDRQALEAYMTGVLIVFWGALWGTFGTEFARGFIEAQLRGMGPEVQHEKFTEPKIQ
jgi:hypothetical protein